MCKYCGYIHGIIGDVVCPIINRFPFTEQKEKFYALEIDYNKFWNDEQTRIKKGLSAGMAGRS